MAEKKITSLTFGLFDARVTYPFHWLRRNLHDLKIYFKRRKFLLKHGYGEQALWESYAYFLDEWEEILEFYRYHRNGTPVLVNLGEDGWEKCNDEAYNELLDRMLKNLRIMKADDGIVFSQETIDAKVAFFADFSKYFFHFWD